MRRFSLRFVLLLLFGLLLYACRNEPGPVRLAPGVTAADYRTFFIQAVRAEGHRIDFEERFDTAVRRALEAKGYRYQVEHGDLRVIYALGLQRQPGLEMRPVITQDGVFTQTQLTEDTEARLALRILDESNGRVLLESVLSRQLHDPALTQEAFDRGIAQIAEGLPESQSTLKCHRPSKSSSRRSVFSPGVDSRGGRRCSHHRAAIPRAAIAPRNSRPNRLPSASIPPSIQAINSRDRVRIDCSSTTRINAGCTSEARRRANSRNNARAN